MIIVALLAGDVYKRLKCESVENAHYLYTSDVESTSYIQSKQLLRKVSGGYAAINIESMELI